MSNWVLLLLSPSASDISSHDLEVKHQDSLELLTKIFVYKIIEVAQCFRNLKRSGKINFRQAKSEKNGKFAAKCASLFLENVLYLKNVILKLIEKDRETKIPT